MYWISSSIRKIWIWSFTMIEWIDLWCQKLCPKFWRTKWLVHTHFVTYIFIEKPSILHNIFAVPVCTHRAHPPLSRHNWHRGPWIPIIQKFGPSPETASRRMDDGETSTVSGRRMGGPYSTPFAKQFEFIQSNVKHHFHPGTLSG